jgi:hypothetical protein
MKTIQYKGYDIFLEIQYNGSILATWSNQWGENRDKAVFYDYTMAQAVSMVKDTIEELLDKPVTFHRNPTQSEIRFGYGATHYKDFILGDVVKQCGAIKAWIVCPYDGLRYYR